LYRELPRSAVNEHAAALQQAPCRRRRIAAYQPLETQMSMTLSATVRRISHYFVRRAAIAHLREFDNDGLKDIGLWRSEIEAAVYGLTPASNRGKTR
jgi:uncharacterized protein YjiS (DUF1127 family)